jgi:hypothetical protein
MPWGIMGHLRSACCNHTLQVQPLYVNCASLPDAFIIRHLFEGRMMQTEEPWFERG